MKGKARRFPAKFCDTRMQGYNYQTGHNKNGLPYVSPAKGRIVDEIEKV
jgi:hypothetical protein